MDSKKIAEYKDFLEYIPDNWVLGKYIDFPQVIYMEFNNCKIPVLQVMPDVFSNYSLETGEKILDYVFFTHKNFQSLLDTKELLEKQVNDLTIQLSDMKSERGRLKDLLKTIKEAYLRISGNLFTTFVLGEKLKSVLESI